MFTSYNTINQNISNETMTIDLINRIQTNQLTNPTLQIKGSPNFGDLEHYPVLLSILLKKAFSSNKSILSLELNEINSILGHLLAEAIVETNEANHYFPLDLKINSYR